MQEKLKNLLKTLHLNESTISTLLGAFVVIIVGALIFNYIKETRVGEQITEEAAMEEAQTFGDVTVEETEEGELIPKQLPIVYEVKSEDSLWKIAEAHYGSGYNWVDIVSENNLAQPDFLSEGQKLTLPKTEVIVPVEPEQVAKGGLGITDDSYTVQQSDNLWEIAVRAYGDGFKWPEIASANNLANPDHIEIGLELKLPR